MDIYHVIRRPLVTEKGTHQSRQSFGASSSRPGRGGAYSFEVHPSANKIEICDAIEKIYGVKVQCVRTSVCSGKRRRTRFKFGMTREWKKAVVVLKPEHHIDLF
jgi:large subunit ribosomal protein L23